MLTTSRTPCWLGLTMVALADSAAAADAGPGAGHALNGALRHPALQPR